MIISLSGITLGVLTLIACAEPSREKPPEGKHCHETVDSRGNIIYFCE